MAFLSATEGFEAAVGLAAGVAAFAAAPGFTDPAGVAAGAGVAGFVFEVAFAAAAGLAAGP